MKGQNIKFVTGEYQDELDEQFAATTLATQTHSNSVEPVDVRVKTKGRLYAASPQIMLMCAF